MSSRNAKAYGIRVAGQMMMTTATIVAAILGLGQATGNGVPLADADFLGKVAKIHLNYMHATEFFVVDQSKAVKPTGKAAEELDRVTEWLRRTARPDLFRLLEKGPWVAYKDVSHRIEPLIAQCTMDGETIRWSCGEKNAALLVDLPHPVDLGSVEKAKAFALGFLGRLLNLPDRPEQSISVDLAQDGNIWGGYLARGLHRVGDRIVAPYGWDTSILVVTDGKHVLARWLLAEPDDLTGKTGKAAIGPSHAPKAKSRFDE